MSSQFERLREIIIPHVFMWRGHSCPASPRIPLARARVGRPLTRESLLRKVEDVAPGREARGSQKTVPWFSISPSELLHLRGGSPCPLPLGSAERNRAWRRGESKFTCQARSPADDGRLTSALNDMRCGRPRAGLRAGWSGPRPMGFGQTDRSWGSSPSLRSPRGLGGIS